jgi:hypothetical protein
MSQSSPPLAGRIFLRELPPRSFPSIGPGGGVEAASGRGQRG